MNFNYENLKNIFIKSFSNFTGLSTNEVEDLPVISTDMIDIPEVGDVVGIEGVSFLNYFKDDIYVYLLSNEQSMQLVLIFGDGCKNIDEAQYYIDRYSRSKYGNIYSVLNQVSDELDSLTLNVNFDVVSEEDAVDMVSFLFSILLRKDFIDAAYPMLQYFDSHEQNIAG